MHNSLDAVFSPNGKFIATLTEGDETTGLGDQTVRLWNLEGQLITTLSEKTDELGENIFSPDSQWMITTKEDITGKNIFSREKQYKTSLWNLSGQLVAELKGSRKPTFSPDGKRLAVLQPTQEGSAIRIYPIEGLLKKYPVADLLPQSTTTRLFPSENLDQLMAQGCTWLYAYLESSPSVSASDRQMCGIAKRE